MILLEGGNEAAGLGGNVFKDDQGRPLTQRINVADVPATVTWLEKITGLNLRGNELGSLKRPRAGTTSLGDLDLGIDATVINNDAVMQVLTRWCQQQKIPAAEILNRPANKTKKDPGFSGGWIKNAGSQIHFRTPISGNVANGFVQADFMFMPDLEFSKQVTGYADGEDFKAADRAILYNSIGKVIRTADFPGGVKFDWRSGLSNRQTNDLITNDFNNIAEILLGPGHNSRDLASVKNTVSALRNDPQREAKLKDARDNFAQRNLQLPESAASVHPTEWLRHWNNRLR